MCTDFVRMSRPPVLFSSDLMKLKRYDLLKHLAVISDKQLQVWSLVLRNMWQILSFLVICCKEVDNMTIAVSALLQYVELRLFLALPCRSWLTCTIVWTSVDGWLCSWLRVFSIVIFLFQRVVFAIKIYHFQAHAWWLGSLGLKFPPNFLTHSYKLTGLRLLLFHISPFCTQIKTWVNPEK